MQSDKKKILKALDNASSCCPIQYIEQHSNIVSPLMLLEELEAEGFITCARGSQSTIETSIFINRYFVLQVILIT